jgi:hypothetical protein
MDGSDSLINGEVLVNALTPESQERRAALLEYAGWRLGNENLDWRGREKEICRLLIPMLTSRYPRVYDTALSWLNRIPRQNRGRLVDADAWREFYEMTYSDRTLDLGKAVEERIVVIQAGQTGRNAYVVEGETVGDIPALEARLRQHAEESRAAGLRLSVIVQAPSTVLGYYDAGRGVHPPQYPAGLVEFEEAKQAAWRVAGNCSVFPENYVIRKPYDSKKTRGDGVGAADKAVNQ